METEMDPKFYVLDIYPFCGVETIPVNAAIMQNDTGRIDLANTCLYSHHPCNFWYEGINMSDATKAYQYAKYKFLGDTEACNTILSLYDPVSIEAYTSTRGLGSPENITRWYENSLRIMKEVQIAKFESDKRLKQALDDTCELPIVEINSTNLFYGCFVGPDGNRVGENHFGEILMEIRKIYRFTFDNVPVVPVESIS